MPMQWREVKIVSANDEHVNKYFFDNLVFFFLLNIHSSQDGAIYSVYNQPFNQQTKQANENKLF